MGVMGFPAITAGRPAIVLAPMEGVTDAPMRALQGALGAFTYSVTEYLRISQSMPSPSVFVHHVPEVNNAGKTTTGLPVQMQILGGHPGRVAEAATIAFKVGAPAIDINFGCPAPTVNSHDGGATLLKYPCRIRDIVQAVRQAIPPHIPVSAKLRLGWDNTTAILENAAMAAEGGASWLTIHARTRAQGYAPPVDWPMIGRVRQQLGIPIIANGDIFALDDFRRCRESTGCEHFMIGRGALANPWLSHQIAHELGLIQELPTTPINWLLMLEQLIQWNQAFHDRWEIRTVRRMKMWLRHAHLFGKFPLFHIIKHAEEVDELRAMLNTPMAAIESP